jgi:hypothetical protein
MAARRVPTRKTSKDRYAGRLRKALDRRAAMERGLAAGANDPAIVLAVQAVIAAADAFTIYHPGER